MSLTTLLLASVVGGAAFLKFSPQFGSRDKAFSKERMLLSENYDVRAFKNIEKTDMGQIRLKTMVEFFFKSGQRKPDREIPVRKRAAHDFVSHSDDVSLTWFGHSAVLVEIEGKKIFFDPMLSNVPAPHPWLGSKRFNAELPLGVDDLPHLDAVIISHDHYDHLDYRSIQAIKEKVRMFFVPLGVGSHLAAWGVEEAKIKEFDWWEETNFDDLLIAATPAKHFSGRSLNDRNATLWASWVVKGKASSVFFSGDSGYTKSFKDIGDKYGPFDITMVECGQYHEDWSQIHMMPEETVQASLDLKSKLMMPIHWGSFTISLHSWDDPVRRALKAAEDAGLEMMTPVIGERIMLNNFKPSPFWWKSE